MHPGSPISVPVPLGPGLTFDSYTHWGSQGFDGKQKPSAPQNSMKTNPCHGSTFLLSEKETEVLGGGLAGPGPHSSQSVRPSADSGSTVIGSMGSISPSLSPSVSPSLPLSLPLSPPLSLSLVNSQGQRLLILHCLSSKTFVKILVHRKK